MIKDTLLIVFSYKYPYDPPIEQFLDDEMHYFLRENIDVLVIPISRDKAETMYPIISNSNIAVCDFSREKRIYEIINGALSAVVKLPLLIRDVGRILHTVDKKNWKYAWRETVKQYIQGGALYKELLKQIPKSLLKGRQKIILYSYWFSPMLLAEAYYKDYLTKKTNIQINAYSRAHGDGDLYHQGLEYYRPCRDVINNLIDCIFPISDSGTEYLKRQGLKNVETYRLGVEKRTEEEICFNDPPIIVSCSVINDNKRVEKIAETLSYIKNNIKWIHFGGGPNESFLKEYCERQLPINIEWNLKGWTPHDEVLNYYELNRPDLFINVSKVEGIPVSIMEAMSFSIPCVATNTGALDEIIVDKGNGFLIPVDFDPKIAAEIISNYLNSSVIQKENMKNTAYSFYNERYNATKNYSEFTKRIIKNR